ncbi:MAG TPA: quinol:cytochrome C oxidoreductase [Puia sp.]
MSLNERFEITPGFRMWSLVLMGVGVLSLIIGYIVYGTGDETHQAIFWGSLLHNAIYFLLITNAVMFFFCATTLSLAGFQISFKRVTEAISACVPVIGGITFVIMLFIVFGHKSMVYQWLDKAAVAKDAALTGKKGFLNPAFFLTWTIVAIGLWSILGYKMRSLSRKTDDHPLSVEEGKKFMFKNTVWASLFIIWYALTIAAIIPWLWLMSLNAHWFSTLYSWYVFASTFVAGIALISVFVVYMKNRGYLQYTNKEHLHDLGKFQFAFSIFWTYLWFAQFMLIWYANISEETVYFRARAEGAYSGIFYLNLVINFLAPILIFMSTPTKRNYTVVAFMSVALLFGHWLDFYQIIFAGMVPDHVPMGLYDFGIAAGFVGVIIYQTGRVMAKFPLLARNHPFFKESIIHYT